jgi:hypothetical protein
MVRRGGDRSNVNQSANLMVSCSDAVTLLAGGYEEALVV